MSTTITISIYVEPSIVTGAFEALLRRLYQRAVIKNVKVHEEYFNVEVPEVHYWQRHLKSIIETIPTSNKMLELALEYRLKSGEIAAMDLLLRGDSYENGFELEVNGPISLSISDTQVNRSLTNILNHPKEQVFFEEVIPTSLTTLKDWEEVFLRVAGIYGSYINEHAVQHAAMYLESGWPSAVGCAMLYHRDKHEFARDFLRIYREYNFGENIPKMLSRNFDLEEINIKRPLERIDTKYYEQFNDSDGDSLVKFLNSLDIDKAFKLASLSETEMNELLLLASKKIPEVTYIDSGLQGGALISQPFNSVWKVYKYIADIRS